MITYTIEIVCDRCKEKFCGETNAEFDLSSLLERAWLKGWRFPHGSTVKLKHLCPNCSGKSEAQAIARIMTADDFGQFE